MVKSKGLYITILILILLGITFLAFSLPRLTLFAVQEQEPLPNVKIATFAVCEPEENGYSHCKDKIFAVCNKTLTEVNESFFYCGGQRHEIGNITLGETYVKNGSQPSKSLITGWATSE